MTSHEDIRRMVKVVCISHGVRVIAMTGYQNFALQVDKTRKHTRGRDLALVVGALVTRYVGLGLERKVLEDIAFAVFNVGAPA